MNPGMTRAAGGLCPLACVLAVVLAGGCVIPAGAGAPPVASVRSPEGRPTADGPRARPVASTPTRATSCALPARVDDSYDLTQLPVFSKALFYVDDNSPVDVGHRSPEMVAGRTRPGEDCLLLLAENVIARAKDPQRSTLLSTAQELASSASVPRPAAP